MYRTIFGIIFAIVLFNGICRAQSQKREFPLAGGGLAQIENSFGRVQVATDEKKENGATVEFVSEDVKVERDLAIDSSASQLRIVVRPKNANSRIDIRLILPARARVRIETRKGAIHIVGDFADARAKTETGTIYADVSLENLKYKFQWTRSKPRYLSDYQLAETKEKSAGRFEIKGRINEPALEQEKVQQAQSPAKSSAGPIILNFTTGRGIILLNVSPTEVPSNLAERPLTKAAKAIIRSGDLLLQQAMRIASPKHFGDYAATLPPRKRSPLLNEASRRKPNSRGGGIKKVSVQVTDINNRAISGLKKDDFLLTERGEELEVLSVEPITTPFNLVLLLDVSGSIENYVDFIRKAARDFINTTSLEDKISIITFSDDVKTISKFSSNHRALSDSLDTFDAGGGTGYYDAIGFTLSETLRKLRGERTAIVILSDGDDNRSFLSFNALLGSIEESGALIYPLYVPSGLIASSATNSADKQVDTLRARYLALTSKAQKEGEILAQISGGAYYPISRLGEIKPAYNDIVRQLRTAYTIKFRSKARSSGGAQDTIRLKVKVKRDTSFVKLGSIVDVAEGETSKIEYSDSTLRRSNAGNKPVFQNTSFSRISSADPDFIEEVPEITGEIKSVKYSQFVADKLRTRNLDGLDINKARGSFLVSDGEKEIAVSRWISPKRTRSYPYERVYDTLAHDGKRVAVIPVVKDEGLGGDRDFIQWDTISLLSLLDVHVVLAYYDSAVRNKKKADKITKQKFDPEFVAVRLKEVFGFEGSAREWNEREAGRLKMIFEKAKISYREISKKTGTYLHNEDRLDERIKYAETPQRFIGYSRRRSKQAQSREFVTLQPNEALSSLSKAKVTITNALFGKYYFTVDETLIGKKSISLIEAKHSSRAKMPSKNDIKDGLIKMMLYTNLRNVRIGARNVDCKVAIRLTSGKLVGSVNSNSAENEIESYFAGNHFNERQTSFLRLLFLEARTNNFMIILEKGVTENEKH